MISIARDRESSQSSEGLAQAQDYLSEVGEAVKNLVNTRPALALGAALAAGVVLGWLIKRR